VSHPSGISTSIGNIPLTLYSVYRVPRNDTDAGQIG
jgi:hypothetical protein